MWPWEHLAVGYLFYSGYTRLVHGDRPGNADAAVLALATQLPDLVDKPLAWSFGVLPSGLSLAHSLAFAVPACLAVAAVAGAAGRPAVGRAFCLGYLSHLAGDAVYGVFTGGGLTLGFLLWPLVRSPPVATPGLFTQVRAFLGEFLVFLSTPRGRLYLAGELTVLAGATAVWVADRYPGVGLVRRGVRSVAALGRRR